MTNKNLLDWQWSLYAGNHQTPRNLVIHALTVPVFMSGTLALLGAAASGRPFAAAGGLLAMVAAMAAQGRGHREETTPPVPFRGPLDVLARIFAEQWITFPRFVLSGGFVRAWRGQHARS